jgi:hypothetical protein
MNPALPGLSFYKYASCEKIELIIQFFGEFILA